MAAIFFRALQRQRKTMFCRRLEHSIPGSGKGPACSAVAIQPRAAQLRAPKNTSPTTSSSTTSAMPKAITGPYP